MSTGSSLPSEARFGQYRIVRLLGRGGMGEVYEAEHTSLERRYALKLWKGRKPRSPSPRPSPQRRGRTIGRGVTNRGIQTARATTDRAPSPRGSGRGQARRSHIGRTRKLAARPAWLPLL